MSKKTKNILLCLGIFVLLAASSLGIFFLVNKKPASKGNVLGVAWYDESGTEFTIDTIEELREFAALSEHYDFEGQTIKLGADIVDNEGTAMDWWDEVPEHLWNPIKNFAGTFDGQGHTISGICSYGFVYVVRDGKTEFCQSGLFTNTKSNCVIKDLRLVNSFFYSDFNEGVGSISSNGGGTFDSIYSSADIVTYKMNAGGIVGLLDARGSHTVTNCWFDGTITVEGNVGRYVGGLVGQIEQTNGTCKIEHCLNTGTLVSPLVNTGVNMGGILGVLMPQGRVQIKDCLTVGSLSNEYGVAVGSVIGNIAERSATTINDVYTIRDIYKAVVGYMSSVPVGFPIDFSEQMLTGYGAYQWTTLDFNKYWSVVEDGTPILKYFAEESPSLEGIEKKYDTSWYKMSEDEYIISTPEQLYGFALLSRTTNFEGKVIRLGADIVINEGDAKEWAAKEPDYSWISIGTVNTPFAGVFDGQMHSISGIYLKTDAPYSGLFSATSELSMIQNLKLENSYFEFGGASSGSISGRGRGKFDTIYSNAIIKGKNINLGGMVGQIPGDGGIIMNNCWFDGNVTNTSNSLSTRYTGGLVGVVLSDSIMTNCLNTGIVDATKFTTPNPNNAKNIVPLAGGLIGYIPSKHTMTVDGCLNIGEVKVNEVASIGYGSIAGYVDGNIKISNTYVLDTSAGLHSMPHCLTGISAVVDADMLKGYSAYQRTLLDFDKYWAVVKNGTPILKSFANDVPSVAGVKKLYDISWYNENKRTYKLDSMQDLNGFALLSYNTDFSKKTIQLTKDIVVNKGNASDWAKKAPQQEWIRIGTSTIPFAGTFDGQMHSVSGIYVKTEDRFGGMFANTTPTAVIKNFKLLNSYIEAEGSDCGSIVGRGHGGKFDTIYSNAIITCAGSRVGGLFGQLYGENITVNNCWYDGYLKATGNHVSQRGAGGIIGMYSDDVCTMSNCLNTGVIDATAYTYNQKENGTLIVPLAGGLVGQIYPKSQVNFNNCLNAGEVKVSDKALAGNIGFGAILGYTEGIAKITDTYATTESCTRVSSGESKYFQGRIKQISEEKIEGYGAYQWTALNFDKYWAVSMKNTPILKSFASTVPSLSGVAKMIDTSWYDADKKEYVLNDAADLYGFAELSRETDFAGKTVKLGKDIVVNEDVKNPTSNWTQIGNTSKPFAGTFDGQMHSISGLYLKSDGRFGGLFAETTTKAVVKNLKLLDSYIEATGSDCGSIVGRGQGGTFDTIYSNATIICSGARVGGLFGQLYGKNVKVGNCWFDGQVKATGNHVSQRGTGGIIGMYSDDVCTISNCLNTGVIDATAYTHNQKAEGTLIVPLAGGIIGEVYPKSEVVLENCLNAGEVKVSDKALAGNVGFGAVYGWTDGKVSLVDTYATKESCARVSGGSGGTVEGAIRQVAKADITGYDGYQWTVLDFDKYWAVALESTPILKSFASSVPSLAGIEKMIDFSWMEKAAGTEEDPYILKDVGDLYGFANVAVSNNFAGKYIKLGADIVVNKGDAYTWSKKAPSNNWTPIGSINKYFAGTFDGNGHTISGIYMNSTSQYAGLFGVTSSTAVIKNLYLKNSFFKSSKPDMGSIVGMGDGQFHTIYSDAILECAGARSGGFIGVVNGKDTKMTNCWFAGTVTSKASVTGGLVGDTYDGTKLTMQSCFFSGLVDVTACTSSTPYAGGLIGQGGHGNSGVMFISDSFVAGKVKANTTASVSATVGGLNKNAKVTVSGGYYTNGWPRSIYIFGAVADLTGKIEIASSYTGDAAKTSMKKLGWGSTWEIVPGSMPVLKSFKSEVYDTSWYDNAKGTEADPYILSDRADLFGFAQKSLTDNFAGKYVKLGADIVVNQGDASTWATGAPGLAWTPIGLTGYNSSKHATINSFAGTFDGAMHTISGIYHVTDIRYNGLFAGTASTATIKNLKLKNSYFKSTFDGYAYFGSVVGEGKGTFDTIYSSAIVETNASAVGGIVGGFRGTGNKINNCWFDGGLTNTGTKRQAHGGIVGYIAGDITMSNCLNTATISSNTTSAPWLGGLIGGCETSNATKVSQSLNVGLIKPNSNQVANFGPIVGTHMDKTIAPTITKDNTYATTESSSYNRYADATTTLNAADIIGDLAKDKMLNLDWSNTWVTVEGKTPVLKSFENEVIGR